MTKTAFECKAASEHSNLSVLSALQRAERVIHSLAAKGVTIKSILLHQGHPVIRVQPHVFCEQMVAEGKGCYVNDNTQPRLGAKFRQGVFIENGCKVVWSASLH